MSRYPDRSYAEIMEDLEVFGPIKVGVLGWCGPDMQNGVPRAISMAVNEALAKGLITRKVEFIYREEDGLSPGLAQNSVDGYNWLCDQGCLMIIGPHSNPNIASVMEASEKRKVPFVSMNGAAKGTGKYAFRLGNGEAGGEDALIINWLEKKGYKNVGILVEVVEEDGYEQFEFFQFEARKRGINIRAVEYANHTPKNLPEQLERIRGTNPDALVFLGMGYNFMMGNLPSALEDLNWDIPKICNASFMFYPVDHFALDGWVGVDQYCPGNPVAEAFKKKYEALYGEELGLDPNSEWCDGLYCLAYDFGQVIAETIFRAPELSTIGMVRGLERIRWLPAATGGIGTHIDCSNYEHNMFSGDWLVLGRIENGELKYEGKYEPIPDAEIHF